MQLKNQSSIMLEDYEESISLTPRTWSSRNLARKSKHGETRSKTNDIKSKLACILEARESTRMRMEENLPKYHEDISQEKKDNSL